MPPFAEDGVESVTHHGFLQEHTVLKLFLCNPFRIRMGYLAKIIKRASHIHFFSRVHIQQRQVNGTSPAVTGTTCDIPSRKQFLLLKVRIKERLHALIQIIHAPQDKMLHSARRSVRVKNLQSESLNIEFVAHRLKCACRLLSYDGTGFLIAVDSLTKKIIVNDKTLFGVSFTAPDLRGLRPHNSSANPCASCRRLYSKRNFKFRLLYKWNNTGSPV